MTDVCHEKHRQIDKQFVTNEKRIDNHSERLDSIEQRIVGQERDTMHLREAIDALNISIKALIDQLDVIRTKPGTKYDNMSNIITASIITAIIAYLMGRLL